MIFKQETGHTQKGSALESLSMAAPKYRWSPGMRTGESSCRVKPNEEDAGLKGAGGDVPRSHLVTIREG